MDLLKNPFHILTASPRDNRRRIMELADERSLLFDSDEIMEAHSDLINTRKRVMAELAWFPGLSPYKANELISLLLKDPRKLLYSISSVNELTQKMSSDLWDWLKKRDSYFYTINKVSKSGIRLNITHCPYSPEALEEPLKSEAITYFKYKKKEKISLFPLTKANLIASILVQRGDSLSVYELTECILDIAYSLEDINLEELIVIINEERLVSGFREITDLLVIETEVQERRRYYLQIIKSALENLSTKELIGAVTDAVECATHNGVKQGLILIDDLVDSYEVEAQVFLEKEEENINLLVKKIRTEADSGKDDSFLMPVVNQLIQVVKNWDTVAQPIQVSAKSRGLNHNASHRVANLVRDLAIHMYNEHGKIEFSKQLTDMLQEAFAEVGEVAERTAEDADALEEIEEQRTRLLEDAKKRAEEWRKEITYDADVGSIFKNKLSISPEGVEWKGRHWNLDSITRIRWGGTRHSINGISTGTTYSVFVGDSHNYTSIELKKGTVYNNFVDCLWRAVGVRLLTEYLEGLRNGKKYNFGSAVLSDHGMELERKNFFGNNEQIFCRWEDLVIWNGSGTFCIRKKDDKKLAAVFSYQEEDNIHVLEAAIRMLWKQGGDTLSSLLKG